MKKRLFSLILALVLILSVGGVTLASPPDAGGGGLVFFGEYAPFGFYEPLNAMTLGAGYAFSDAFALGVEAQVYTGVTLVGGFANLSVDPVIIKGEVLTNPSIPAVVAKVTGLYTVDLNPLSVGMGGGAVFIPVPGMTLFFVEANASIAMGDILSLYFAVDQYIGLSLPEVTCGISASF